MPIVTTSSSGRPRKSAPPMIAVAAILGIALAAYLFLREGSASSGPLPQNPKSAAPDSSAAPQAVFPIQPLRPPTMGDVASPPAPEMAESSVPAPATPDGKNSVQAARYRWSKEQLRLQASYVYPTPGQARLENGKILTFHTPAEGQSVKFFADGKTYECFHDGTFIATESAPTFDDPFEEQLLHLATPGATFLPGVLLNHTEDELKAVLAKAVEIGEDDPDEIKEKKQVVAEMKAMIADYIAQGGDYIDFIEQMQKYSQEERNLRTLGLVKLHNFVDDGDIDGARAFIGTYNEILDEQGFAPLAPPPAIQKLLDKAE